MFEKMLQKAEFRDENTKICVNFKKNPDGIRMKCKYLVCNHYGKFSCLNNIQCGYWCTSFVQMGIHIGRNLHVKNQLCSLPLRI